MRGSKHPDGIAYSARKDMYEALSAYMRQEICAAQFDRLIDDAWRRMLDDGPYDDSVELCFFGLWYTYTDWDRRFLKANQEHWDFYRRTAAFLQTDLTYPRPVVTRRKWLFFNFKKNSWTGFEPFNGREEWGAHERLVDHFSKAPPPRRRGKVKLVPGQIF